ncbi:MAG: ATP-binding cassette domain-containing protein [Bacilli bacterium]|nr:ATP-binding cassette domain-containing protein [Bacilli bacterium]
MAKSKTLTNTPLIKIVGVKKHFPLKKTRLFQREVLTVKANDGIDLTINKGETLGLVGESGCGKSTLGRVLLQLYPVTSGKIIYYGYNVDQYAPKYFTREIRRLHLSKEMRERLEAKIPLLEEKIKELQADEVEKAKRNELAAKIKELEKANQNLWDECHGKHQAFIVSEDIHAIRRFPKLDSYIAKAEAKITKLQQKIDDYEGTRESAKQYRNPKAEAEVVELKKQIEVAELSCIADLNKKLAIAERKANYKLYELDLNILNTQNKINLIKNEMMMHAQRIKSSLDKPIELSSDVLKSLVEYKEKYHANKQLIKQYQAVIDFKKQKDEIQKIQNRIDKILDNAANATGGYVLSNQSLKVSQSLFQRVANLRKIVDEEEKIQICKVAKFRTEKELEAKKDKLTNLQINKLQKKIVKYEENLALSDQKIQEFNRLVDEANVELRKLKEEVKQNELFDELEAKREKGIDLSRLTNEEMRILRKHLQLIFQDPYSSLNPRMTVGQIIYEGIRAHHLDELTYDDKQEQIIKVMEKCGLAPYMLHRYPHQFSGGQRQRIGIARALAVNPTFVVCDEAVSALDVSIQSQIINLLEDLRDNENLTYLFISHDLSVIKHISDRIGVMYLGNMVELGDSDAVYERPLHPYTKALISSIPTTDQEQRKRILLEGDIPSNVFPPSGCKFRTRCPLARKACAEKVPEFREVEPGRFVACHFYEETENLR